MRAEIKITYDSGETVTVDPNRPRALLELERKYGLTQPEGTEHTFWLAWVALGNPGDDFEAWVDTVAHFEFVNLAEMMQLANELGMGNGEVPKAGAGSLNRSQRRQSSGGSRRTKS